jgi:hypothetical protein
MSDTTTDLSLHAGEKKFNKETARPLTGCVSQETAFVQPDYPYGRRLRCQRRVWIETNPRHGMRFVTQTSNPKRRGEVWNKPHTSTYSDLIGLWVDDKGFVARDSLVNAGYYSLEELKAWGERNKALIEADDYVRNKFAMFVKAREAYEQAKARGEIKFALTTSEYIPGQGIVRSTETVTVE